jgi:hypothetical protein
VDGCHERSSGRLILARVFDVIARVFEVRTFERSVSHKQDARSHHRQGSSAFTLDGEHHEAQIPGDRESYTFVIRSD